MTRTRPKVVLQAHAARSAAALALLLHARDRGPRDLRSPFAALIGSLVLALIIVAAVVLGNRIGGLIGTR